jgi:hypothetical protein
LRRGRKSACRNTQRFREESVVRGAEREPEQALSLMVNMQENKLKLAFYLVVRPDYQEL